MEIGEVRRRRAAIIISNQYATTLDLDVYAWRDCREVLSSSIIEELKNNNTCMHAINQTAGRRVEPAVTIYNLSSDDDDGAREELRSIGGGEHLQNYSSGS